MTWSPFRRHRDRSRSAGGSGSVAEQEFVGYVARAGSTIGRRGVNQDRALVAGPVVAVADGVGGSVRGDAAAQVALGRIAIDGAFVGSHDDPERAVRALVAAAHVEASRAAAVFGAAETSSTLALVHLSRPEEALADDVLLTIAWVGDSPVFVADRRGVEQVTVPHTESPSGHAGGGFGLLRALGGSDAIPGVASRLVTTPCRLILASDGILDVPREVVDAVLLDLSLDADRCLEELLVLVQDVRVNDNTTIAVVDLLRTVERATLTGVF